MSGENDSRPLEQTLHGWGSCGVRPGREIIRAGRARRGRVLGSPALMPRMGRLGLVALLFMQAAFAARLDSAPSSRRHGRDSSRGVEAKVIEGRLRGVPGTSLRVVPMENETDLDLLLRAPHLAVLRSVNRTLQWLRKQNPGLWFIVATAMVAQHQYQKSRHDKFVEVDDIRSRVLDENYHISIVTTAALPWMTGTSVNPLLRAAYLAKAGKRVTLMVPWVHPLDQKLIFPAGLAFDTPLQQEEHIRKWLLERAGVRVSFELRFYPGR